VSAEFHFFLCGGKKNKKHSVGQRVGIDAVQLQYGLYVFGHQSKWFVVVLMFKFYVVWSLLHSRPTIGYNSFIAAINLRLSAKLVV
jgi:hypothetical protein